MAAFVTVLFCACSPQIVIQAKGADEATVAFSAGFSQATEQTLKSIVGAISGQADDGVPLFTASDISALLQHAGLQNVTAATPDGTNIAASGKIPAVSQSALAAAGIITRSQTSLTLTVGAKQFQSLYVLLDEESQAYFDLLMIPALTEETMTPAEYNDLLASVYGQTFAKEMTDGTCRMQLIAPDGKKSTTATLTVGELLTLSAEKSWSVQW